jgi:hypothetical protein
MPDDLLELVRAAAKKTGLSQQDVMRGTLRQYVPAFCEQFKAKDSERITNVDPLPRKVLERLYREREEEDEAGVQLFIKAQAFGGED